MAPQRGLLICTTLFVFILFASNHSTAPCHKSSDFKPARASQPQPHAQGVVGLPVGRVYRANERLRVPPSSSVPYRTNTHTNISTMRISLALSLLTATAAAAAPLTQLTFSSSSLSDLTIASLGLSPSLSSQLAIHVDSLPEKRVVQLGPNDDQRITITEGEKAVLVAQGRRFVDVTDEDPALFGGFGTAIEERGELVFVLVCVCGFRCMADDQLIRSGVPRALPRAHLHESDTPTPL